MYLYHISSEDPASPNSANVLNMPTGIRGSGLWCDLSSSTARHARMNMLSMLEKIILTTPTPRQRTGQRRLTRAVSKLEGDRGVICSQDSLQVVRDIILCGYCVVLNVRRVDGVTYLVFVWKRGGTCLLGQMERRAKLVATEIP